MPSQSYSIFQNLLVDVDKIIKTYNILKDNGKNLGGLGHLSRSGILMLCAAWETYNEELLLETIDVICNHVDNASLLPVKVKKTISTKIRADRNEIMPIELTGFGWKNYWKIEAEKEVQALNTPKSDKLKILFHRYTGIDDITSFWENYSDYEIDNFVSLRGGIAHKGRNAKNVRIDSLKNYYEIIKLTVIDTDSYLAEHIKNNYIKSGYPWMRSY